MLPLSDFPALDAALNAASALLLSLGLLFIRRKRVGAHKLCMLSAFSTSTLFLICYLWYHAHHGVTRFAGRGLVWAFYLTLLGSAMVVTLVAMMVMRRHIPRVVMNAALPGGAVASH